MDYTDGVDHAGVSRRDSSCSSMISFNVLRLLRAFLVHSVIGRSNAAGRNMEDDSIKAREHHLIKAFTALVDETVGDGILSFDDLKSRPFLKFWKHLFIYRFDEQADDFRVILYGTHIVTMYGNDWTGKLMSEMGMNEAYADIRALNMRIINGERRVYASGNFFWQNREERIWHQVKMPLQRNGDINEVLICADIS
jgi:hypothetical protein